MSRRPGRFFPGLACEKLGETAVNCVSYDGLPGESFSPLQNTRHRCFGLQSPQDFWNNVILTAVTHASCGGEVIIWACFAAAGLGHLAVKHFTSVYQSILVSNVILIFLPSRKGLAETRRESQSHQQIHNRLI